MVPLRVCRVCGLEAHTMEDLELFSSVKTCRYGKDLRCKKCTNARRRERYTENREVELERGRKWRANNPEKVKECNRNWREANREKTKGQSTRYRNAHPFKRLFIDIKSRCKKKNLPYDIDTEFLKRLWKDCGKICPKTGVEMELQGGRRNPLSVSVDRIIPERGYTKSNVRLVSLWYNIARSFHSDDVTLEMCQRVVERNAK